MQNRAGFLYGVIPVLLVAGALFAGGPGLADDAFQYNKRLGRGINLGNALDAPREEAWGVKLQEDYFRAIKKAGFDSVRIPICWSAHAKKEAPFEIKPAFFDRVDWAIDQAIANGLLAVIDVHHDDDMANEPEKSLPRLMALWKQIALRYRDRPDELSFEILNEPTGKLKDGLWNQMIPQLLGVIRQSNPRRIVIVGPVKWNAIWQLDKLALPDADRRLIATVHYYAPMPFTHQSASWVKGSDQWKGTRWTAAPEELAALNKDFDHAAAWGKEHQRPLWLGEFGAYSAADMDSRARWTRAVAEAASSRGMSWAYWEFCSGFGAYDPKAGAWRRPLLSALLGD